MIDIDKTVQPKDYNLILCKLSGEQLQELYNIENFETKKYHANIDEISFDVPLYRMESDGTKVKNELFDLVDGSMLVLVDNSKYFILTKPEIKANNETGETYKSVLGFSREYEFVHRKLSGYHGVSRLLYDYTNAKDENGLEIGFLNYIEKTTSWKIGYINRDLLLKYRELNFSSVTYLQAFQEVQKTFGCLFKYNTTDKIIDVYEVMQLGKNQGLYISDYNFINNLNQTINYDEVVTRLYLYGRNNISVQSINITGLPYIDNFSFFKNTKYMSQSLIDALDDYEDYLETKEGIFSGYLTQLNTLNDILATKRIELADLITELKLIESDLDVAIASGQSTTTLKQQQTAKINQINNKQLEIENVMAQIDAVHININNLGADVSLNSHLTEEQAIELDQFIREDEYRDSNYTEDNLEEFLEEGTKILKRISYPALQFDISVDDFLTLTEGQHLRSKFMLGDLATVRYEELEFNYEVRFVGYTHNPEDKKLNLTFSNRNSVDDANIYISDLLESITTTASTVDFNRYKWDKGEEAEFIINEYVNNALNLALQQITKAEGQMPIMDERGIWITKENPDGTVDPKAMRLVNNVLAITNDNWNTVSTAISGDGIAAEYLVGKIGQFAQLDANQIIVGDDEQALPAYIEEQDKNITVHQIILSNENQSIITDSSGIITSNITIQSNIDVFRGITKVSATIGNLVLKNSSGTTISFGTLSKINPTSTTSGSVTWTLSANTNISDDFGWIEIPITVEDKSYTKKLTWNKSKAGTDGAQGAQGPKGSTGSPGAPAKTVNITATNAYFSATINSSGNIAYSPSSITLKAQFENCTYSRWNYSYDGSTMYVITSGSRGLTISGQDLIISNTSSLFSSQSSIVFRAISTTGEYDLITIARLSDIEDTLMQNYYYNKTKITQDEGIEVFDNLNNRVLQIGGIDTTGNGVKDNYGFIAYHEDGSASIMDDDGFGRLIIGSGNVYKYISLDAAGEGEAPGSKVVYHEDGVPTDEDLDYEGIGIEWVTIPNVDFKGRNFKVIPSFAGYTDIYTAGSDSPSVEMTIKVNVLEYDYPNGKFKIRARTQIMRTWYNPREHRWYIDGCKYSYYAYATT